MLRALVYVVPVALAIYALIDLSRSEPFERVGIRRSVWVAIVVLLPVVGPIAWIAVSRSRRSSEGPRTGTPSGGRPGPTGPSRPGGRPPRRQGSRAPDDDPDFLWRLEQQQRRRGRGAASPDAKPSDGDPTTEPDEPSDPGTSPEGAPTDGTPPEPDEATEPDKATEPDEATDPGTPDDHARDDTDPSPGTGPAKP